MKNYHLSQFKGIQINLVFITCLLTSISYAQDPQLLDNPWYLHDLIIDSQSHVPPINEEIPFVILEFQLQNSEYRFHTYACPHGAGGSIIQFYGDNMFQANNVNWLAGGCNDWDNEAYSHLYQFFWNEYNNSGNYTYEIITNGTNKTLIITYLNSGNQAIYGNQLLSMENKNINDFSLYPNPSKDFISLSFNQGNKDRKAFIFNTNGKLIKAFNIKNKDNKINIEALNSGLYFLKIKDNTNKTTTKKIIKK
jgi:hypothetical protein